MPRDFFGNDPLVNFRQATLLLLGLGTNSAGRWGAPAEALVRACSELEKAGVKIVGASNFYQTDPVGWGRQARYINAVIAVEAGFAPAQLLRLVKRLEAAAGRRTRPTLQPRPLDIDLLDFGGRRLGWPPGRRRRGSLVLPHPEMHHRAFVLIPLQDIAPQWRHPVRGLGVKGLLARQLPAARAGARGLDFRPDACHKGHS